MTAFQHDVLGNTFQHACLSVPAKGTQCRLPARLGAVGVDSQLRAVMELVIEKDKAPKAQNKSSPRGSYMAPTRLSQYRGKGQSRRDVLGERSLKPKLLTSKTLQPNWLNIKSLEPKWLRRTRPQPKASLLTPLNNWSGLVACARRMLSRRTG